MENYDKLVEEHRETVAKYEPKFSSGELSPHELHSYWEARHFLDFDKVEQANGSSEITRKRIVRQYEHSRKKFDELERKVVDELRQRMLDRGKKI